jgi:KDO2-lipid IV(A) lauroyltransferase
MQQSLLDRVRSGLRYDGLWWRRLAYLGSVYGPEWWKRYSPPGFALAIFLGSAANRRGATETMKRVLGTGDEWTARLAAFRMFCEFSHCLAETLEYYSPRPRPIRLDPPAHDPILESLRQGRGAVLVTGHFGNWDIAAKTLRDYGRPINVVMARDVNESTQEYVRRARERVGVRVIYSDTSVFSSLNIIRALRQNEIVALQLDRMLGPGGARMLPFFGAPAPFPSGPFVLARLSGAPLYPVFIPRLGMRHYAIRIGTCVALAREARDAHALERAMRQVVGEFEAAVREFPTQWFQFRSFWPERAEETSADRPASAASGWRP